MIVSHRGISADHLPGKVFISDTAVATISPQLFLSSLIPSTILRTHV